MRRIFATKTFRRWQKKTGLPDKSLIHAIDEIERGNHDGDLGSYLIKKRIPLPGGGKRGGIRTIIVNKCKDKDRRGDNWFFLYGFEKSEKENIDKKEEKALKMLADDYVRYKNAEIKKALSEKELKEIIDDAEKQEKPNH